MRIYLDLYNTDFSDPDTWAEICESVNADPDSDHLVLRIDRADEIKDNKPSRKTL